LKGGVFCEVGFLLFFVRGWIFSVCSLPSLHHESLNVTDAADLFDGVFDFFQ
jgi:hypothetical protein